MNFLYEETSLTPLKVARESGYIDYAAQPSSFKHYPDFLFRYDYGSIEALHIIELARMISSTKNIGQQPYYQLTPPSAGNLHPLELYVQIRGVQGVLSGIYHVNAKENSIVLIAEIQNDGLEAHLGIDGSIRGMIFVVSVVPFRAEWKYGERAVRYCYLDTGHQIGALNCSLQLAKQKMTILSDFDKEALNKQLGFKDEEFVSAVAYSGKLEKKRIIPFKQKLMHVAPTDYSELDGNLSHNIQNNGLMCGPLMDVSVALEEPHIFKRRSARYFDATRSMQKEAIESFVRSDANMTYPLNSYVILMNDNYKKAGVYSHDKVLKEGDFTQKMCELLVDQKFIKNADMVFVITSKYFSSNSLMQAGVYVHNLYMQAQVEGLGCSGIGAFYDTRMQKFLNTQEYILYVAVVGEKRDEL